MDRRSEYWFRAKTYGWGWGLPIAWQGWLTLAVFFALACFNFILFPPVDHEVPFYSGSIILTLALVGICWLKGEPPKWRWGSR